MYVEGRERERGDGDGELVPTVRNIFSTILKTLFKTYPLLANLELELLEHSRRKDNLTHANEIKDVVPRFCPTIALISPTIVTTR